MKQPAKEESIPLLLHKTYFLLIQASVLSRKPPTKHDIEEIEVNRDCLSVKYRVWAEAQLQIKKIDVQKKKLKYLHTLGLSTRNGTAKEMARLKGSIQASVLSRKLQNVTLKK
jgi:hypothetical protein